MKYAKRKPSKEDRKVYTGIYISPIGIAASVINIREAFKKSERCFRKYMRNARSNNWLKMHGYPMRRKGELA